MFVVRGNYPRQYCDHHNIEIVGNYWEDYSAKTFDRPEFNKFLAHIKSHRNTADLLLFLNGTGSPAILRKLMP